MWRRFADGDSHFYLNPEELPLRAELFSVDQLERHAKEIAATHGLVRRGGSDKLLVRLEDNERVLVETYDLVTAAASEDRRIEPAAEWLLDNFYLVEQQIQAIRRLLPPAFSRELPRLTSGSDLNVPRVYAIAIELISHVDGRVDSGSLDGFMAAYQSVQPLKLGELWALPLMLRLAIVENLRRVSVRIASARRDRDLAVKWAGRMVEVVERKPTDLVIVLAEMAHADVSLSGAFLAELTRHLQGQNPNFALANSWLEHRLADQGLTSEHLIRVEGQAQAADQVSIGNSFTSLRFLNANDWRRFVGEQSVVEQTLALDPSHIYAQMDFSTRDRYRHAVEGIARRSRLGEIEVARQAVNLANQNSQANVNPRASHVGYFLVDRGRPELERVAEMRLSPKVLIDKLRRRMPLTCFLSVVVFITTIASFLFLYVSSQLLGFRPAIWLLVIPAIIAALQLGVAITNWLANQWLSPQSLPRLDFREGIPPTYRTIVAVPTMLTSAEGVDRLLGGIELRYLNNRDSNLHFALLTDFTDSPSQTCHSDEELVGLAKAGIERLNLRYVQGGSDIFYLFHRSRQWNDAEGVWMGRERKRGKLADLNATLRGAKDRFAVTAGRLHLLSGVRYVITLDTDTQLPRDAARELVGTLAHPLNQAVHDERAGRVIDGYSILQPRVDIGFPGGQRSRFVQLYALDSGVDPYTRVVSDVYQDLLSEGSFIGKGIYDIDSFERCCHDFPENTILSHDLIEGAYGRSALVSDVTLYEEYPTRYSIDAARRHRWIRGDWQIAGWLLPRVRDHSGQRVRNPISAFSKWKIFDNLRRSLTPIAMLLLLLISWSFSPALAFAAIAFLAIIVFLPTFLVGIADSLRKPVDLPVNLHLQVSLGSLRKPLIQNVLTFVFLPFEAFLSFDAIVRTTFRILITKRRLLQWQTASDAQSRATGELWESCRRMMSAPILALLAFSLLITLHRGMLTVAVPWLIVWTLSPLIAWWLSCPIPKRTIRLSRTQQEFLGKVSRKTWRYFEEFVAPEDNWLPPDNIHQNPKVLIATRTSPTNIGMALLADLAAYDFGYCSATRFLDRTQNTFDTLSKMERHCGHFFNWYHTRTLEPLHPRYVSTVDSGNLVGNLLVLASGCRELCEAPILPSRMMAGLQDTMSVLLDALKLSPDASTNAASIRNLGLQRDTLPKEPCGLSQANEVLTRLRASLPVIAFEDDPEVSWWLKAYLHTLHDHQADLMRFMPWVTMLPVPDTVLASREKDSASALSQVTQSLELLERSATLRDIAGLPQGLLALIENALADAKRENLTQEVKEWIEQLAKCVVHASENASERIETLQRVAAQSQEFAEMDFRPLYNKSRDLFATGFNVSDRRLDTSFYDLLASEARLISYILVAQGQFGQEHWFALGRLLTSTSRLPALLSWSGSMFEYLMPLLVMPNYENTLLDSTYHAAVRRQIEYGRQRGVPWGISESGYNAIDQYRTYQYRAFGVPGMGLKRGLAEDLVIAPYASVLGLMVEPEAACRNLERLASDQQFGSYGFYEAVDYTPSRIPPGADRVTVRQFMSHHEGMSLLSLAYVLLGQPMQRRFLADPMLKAGELLLQERIPKATAPVFPHAREASTTRLVSAEVAGTMRVLTDPNNAAIEAHLLSNGRYHVAITSAGGGYSRWDNLSITRWREDATRDNYGSFCYLRDIGSGAIWSNAWQPTTHQAESYEAIFTQARAEFRRSDEQIETYTQISVSPEDDVELRRVTLTNRSDTPRTIELTSYAEVVMATLAQDESHPAFSNLFVQTELVRERTAIYCTRRARSAEEHPPWMTHMMTVRGKTIGEASYETDRMRFIGRQRTLASPAALDEVAPLSNTSGPVLDPIVSIRQTVVLQPDESVRVDIVIGMSESRAGVQALTEKYHDPNLADRVFDLAWTHGSILLQQLSISEADAQIYGKLTASIIFASSLRRAKSSVLLTNRKGQSGLWSYGISGDLPIVLVRIRDQAHIALVQQAVLAHAYWRMKGLAVDLVIWNEDDSIYRQNLQETVVDLVAASPEAAGIDRPGGVFIRRGEQMSEEDRALLLNTARIVLLDDNGTLAEQTERRGLSDLSIPSLIPVRRSPEPITKKGPKPDLAYYNGMGGFSQDGREYVTTLDEGQTTPAPWVNVIANSQFGTVVSEGGSAYTWAENSHEYRLTPWHNDPVSDVGGEAIYVRDEESGRYWSPTPSPVRGRNRYTIRHGFGYTIFEYTEDGLTTELMIYVSVDAPVKFYKLKVTNRSGRPRKISLTAYWELVLGDSRGKSLQHIVTEADAASGAILARNVYSPEFSEHVAFVNCSEPSRTFTGDRTEFIGRNGNLASPSAMRRRRLSGRVGAGYDPCAAFQAPIAIADGQERIVTFTLGAAKGMPAAKSLAQRFRMNESANLAIHEVWGFWSRTLGAVHIECPDASVNFLANGWLIYQTLACRMWARSGFYQSGGAFGFRDQLQDAMALVYAQPQLLREHLLRAAAHQFQEGDVQHWWHPPGGRGVRTHFSDDYLWLPLAICRYVSITGDTSVLEERVPFLSARPLRNDEESNYDLPQVSDEVGTLFEHGVRAINRGLRFGDHGLPLMGCGDWNDGMNLVGQHGKGESVWLGFFLFHVMTQFAELAQQHNDSALAQRYLAQAGKLQENLERNGWDGSWYRRAYFDDGQPLGSALNQECQIDAISQSWSVLSGAGSKERTAIAMESLGKRLVRRDARLILLLDPPFDKSSLNPGYIKGYVPGVRENGGQYTHSAIWAVMATAARGDNQLAWELFSMINPVSHGSTPESISKYRVEPYVVAADVYGIEPHTGRGGWTWYTGSASWMYRLIIESFIGLQIQGNQLRIKPCLPGDWKSVKVHYRYHATVYHITLNLHATLNRISLDGRELNDEFITLHDDHQDHHIEIDTMNRQPAEPCAML